MMEFESVWRLITDDIQSTSGGKEFIPTRTSRAIGNAIWRMVDQPDSRGCASLDVGTGTGIHAILMTARGDRHVTAIDSSVRAIEYARERWNRLRHIVAVSGKRVHDPTDPALFQIRFRAASIDNFVPSLPLDLITFNATAYFDFIGARSESPISEAVYVDDDWRHGLDAERSAMYRFFKRIVLPNLQVGGSVLCTWFGLERRLVDVVEESTGARISHPVHLLARWFPGFRIIGHVPGGVEFYDQTAHIASDYGLGPTFRENLVRGYEAGLYSQLFRMGDDVTPPEFRFGVLHLIRTTPPPDLQFRLGTSVK